MALAVKAYFDGLLERVKAKLAPGIPKSRKAIDDLPDRLDDDFWDDEEEILLGITLPLLSRQVASSIDIEGAALSVKFGIEADWTLANAHAIEWARKHGGWLVSRVSRTTKRDIGRVVATWIETPGATMGDLFETLAQRFSFSSVRAEMIGVTEVTTSYAEGRAQTYREAGIPVAIYKPPAHIRCRCWDATEILPNGQLVVVWRTNRDELVCVQPLTVPWGNGSAVGCQDLENRILSEGPYLGLKFDDAALLVAASMAEEEAIE